MKKPVSFFLILVLFCLTSEAHTNRNKFNVIAFYTAKNDLAHISFVHEANRWFLKMSKRYHFNYDSTQNWDDLNFEFLSHYQVVIFLDTRPDSSNQRTAFQNYMDHGGSWMGFHFSAFALTASSFP